MQDAVGDADNWIRIDGMAGWRVKCALSVLESASDPPLNPIDHSAPPDRCLDQGSSRAVGFEPAKDTAL